MEKMEDVVRHIKAYFREKNLTMNDVANMMGVSQAAVSGQLSGRPIGRNIAKRYNELFGFDINYLMTGVGSLFPEGERTQAPTPKGDGVFIPTETLQMYKDMAQSIRLLSELVSNQRAELPTAKRGNTYLDITKR